MGLNVEPSEYLEFFLSEEDVNTDSQCVLRLSNTLSDEAINFKVKTTKPKRYLVRPNQGTVAPNSTETVTIILLSQEKKALLAEYAETGAWDTSHKFQVQSCPEKEGQPSTGSLQKKLTVKFKLGGPGGGSTVPSTTGGSYQKTLDTAKGALASVRSTATSATAAAAAAASGAPKSRAGSGGAAGMGGTASMGYNNQLMDDLKTLRKKYDDLVAFTVSLTAERDLLQRSLEAHKQDAHRESARRKELENQLAESGGRPGRTQGAGSKSSGSGQSSALSGFTLFQLFIAAALAFFLGKLYGGS